jgi:hypothetical protein
VVVATVSALFAMGELALAWPVASAFVRMYADFGGALPAGTEFAVGPGRVVLTVIALVACASSIAAAIRGREAWPGGVAIAAQLAASAVFLWLLYLPVFSIAGSIK